VATGGGGDTIVNNTTIVTGGDAPDLTIPGVPSGLVATGTAMNVIVEWTHITDINHGYVEVWRSDTNNIGFAVMVGTSNGDIYADAIGISNATRYYWIRAVSKTRVKSGYNAGPSSGVEATTGKIGSGDLISVDGAKIVDATIVDAKIYGLAATKITSGRIDATQSVEVGTGSNKVVIDGLGNVRMGATGYATGSGFWIGENAGLSKFYLGTPTEYIKYNGSNLEIATPKFTLDYAGNATFSGNLDAPTGTLGAVTIGTTGHIKGGQTAYNTGSGFFLGYSGSDYKFSIGNPLGQYITWDGEEMLSNGLAKLGGIAIYAVAGIYTFTVPANVNKIYVVECTAGGGGGVNGRPTSGSAKSGGGGAAGQVKQWIQVAVMPFEEISITVGEGGLKNSSFGGAVGTLMWNDPAVPRGGTGQPSSVGSYVTSIGGEGGFGMSQSPSGTTGGWQGRPADIASTQPSVLSWTSDTFNVSTGTGSTPTGGDNLVGFGARTYGSGIIIPPSSGGGGSGRISNVYQTEADGASGRIIIIW
jgi:hypothetical protein